jgi:hypothetical protein
MEGYLNLKEFGDLGLVRFYIVVGESYLQFASRKEDFKLGNYGFPVIISDSYFGGKQGFDERLKKIREFSIKVEVPETQIDILLDAAKETKRLEIKPGVFTIDELKGKTIAQPNLKKKVNRILDPILKKYLRSFPFDYYV